MIDSLELGPKLATRAEPPVTPKLDEATRQKMAAAPSRVGVVSQNIVQYRTAAEIIKKIKARSFGEVTDYMPGYGRKRRDADPWRRSSPRSCARRGFPIPASRGVGTAPASRATSRPTSAPTPKGIAEVVVFPYKPSSTRSTTGAAPWDVGGGAARPAPC